MPDSHNIKDRQQAFLALYEPVHQRFARFCHAKAYKSCDAKDLISETVLRAYEDFDKLRDHNAFLHFLFGIATNILRSQWRRQKFWRVFCWLDATEKYVDQQDPELSTDVSLLYEALRQLPGVQQEAIILFEISGFTLKQVQEIQQVSLSAVKSRIVRGKKRLAQLLFDQETVYHSGGHLAKGHPSCVPAVLSS